MSKRAMQYLSFIYIFCLRVLLIIPRILQGRKGAEFFQPGFELFLKSMLPEITVEHFFLGIQYAVFDLMAREGIQAIYF